MEHYFSLTWMTYRAHFTPIPGTMLTTDCGWGCMVRSGQMMLATVLHYQLLSRGQLSMCTCNSMYIHVTVLPCNSSDWRLSASRPSEKAIHKQVPTVQYFTLTLRVRRFFDFPQILSWFADVPRLLCPFSLHAMMKQAQARGHSPGDWFGPSQVAMLIR